MPFGLTNAPATFQSYIHNALNDLLDVTCVVYLDDILIFSKDRDSHTKAIKEVLERLQNAGLYAKLSKCDFYQESIEFLGLIVDEYGTRMDEKRVEAILQWEQPKTYRDIQVFIGFCNFYRRFIPRFSLITTPLTNLLKGTKNGRKPGSVELIGPALTAFQQLKEAFKSADLIRHFDPEKKIRLETDASNEGMAGVLSQPDDNGTWHPVAFWSRKFSGPELNYATPDQELYAIVHSFQQWRHYLDGSKYEIEVLTDHANLRIFMTQQKLNGRQARWCMYLTPFNFVIKHRSGKTNPVDGLSRRPNSERVAPDIELMTPIRNRIVGIEPHVLEQMADSSTDDETDNACNKSQFGLGESPQQGDPGSSAPQGVCIQSICTKQADWAEWETLCQELDIPFSGVPHATVTAVSLQQDDHDLQTWIYHL